MAETTPPIRSRGLPHSVSRRRTDRRPVSTAVGLRVANYSLPVPVSIIRRSRDRRIIRATLNGREHFFKRERFQRCLQIEAWADLSRKRDLLFWASLSSACLRVLQCQLLGRTIVLRHQAGGPRSILADLDGTETIEIIPSCLSPCFELMWLGL